MCTACRRREVEGSRLYKADCERRALRWVECLLEPDISKELLEQAVGLRIALLFKSDKVWDEGVVGVEKQLRIIKSML